jgi:hypothetical protein
MNARQPKYSAEEFRRRGTELYESTVRPRVEEGNKGKVVAIDIDTGEFEIAANSLTACQSLLARLPDAQILCVRIGYPAVHHWWGGRRRRTSHCSTVPTSTST